MFNRGLRALVLVSMSLLWSQPLVASGTIPLSMTQQLDQYGVPLSGCKLYTFQAGTTSTPQNAYKDTALTPALVQPNPMTCDASGRLPQFFLADGQIKIRLEDKLGNPQVVLDNILVIGPSSGGGSGATIDATTIAATGDLKHVYGAGVISGWVRLNGRTIGNAVSGATERANADTQALFLALYAADTSLVVSGGRTNAAADYAANKTIALPDGRGRALAGLDDMGSSAASRLTSTYWGGNATVVGTSGGSENLTLTVAQLPSITSTGSTGTITSTGNNAISVSSQPSGVVFPANTVPSSLVPGGGSQGYQTGGSSGNNVISSNPAQPISVSGSGSASVTSTGTTSTPHRTVGPSMVVTIYIKL